MTEIQGITSQYPRRPMPPAINYNAVKIDIHNPQVNAEPHRKERNDGYCTPPVIYDYPKAPVYDVPKVSVYEPQRTMDPFVTPSPKSMDPRIKPTVPPPVVIQQPVEKVEKEPESVIAQKNNVTNPIEASKAEAPEVAAPKKVEVKKPEAVKPALDINAFIKELASSDYKTQAAAMEAAVQLIQLAPNTAVDLLDVKVVETLLNLVNQNTSNLPGPSPRQIEIRERIMTGQSVTEAELAEANKITPMELAEKNKQYAIFTIASLDKLYGSEVKKITGEQPPITELPGISNIVEQIGTNPNPMVRIAGLKALNYIKAPEYKDELKAVYSLVASTETDPIVKETAQVALKRLED